jgi:hypothetical protein
MTKTTCSAYFLLLPFPDILEQTVLIHGELPCAHCGSAVGLAAVVSGEVVLW